MRYVLCETERGGCSIGGRRLALHAIMGIAAYFETTWAWPIDTPSTGWCIDPQWWLQNGQSQEKVFVISALPVIRDAMGQRLVGDARTQTLLCIHSRVRLCFVFRAWLKATCRTHGSSLATGVGDQSMAELMQGLRSVPGLWQTCHSTLSGLRMGRRLESLLSMVSAARCGPSGLWPPWGNPFSIHNA